MIWSKESLLGFWNNTKNHYDRYINKYYLKGLPRLEWGFYTQVTSLCNLIFFGSIFLEKNYEEGKRFAYYSVKSFDVMMERYDYERIYKNTDFNMQVFNELQIIYLSLITNNHELIQRVLDKTCLASEYDIDNNNEELYLNIYRILKSIYSDETENIEYYFKMLNDFRSNEELHNYIYYIDALEAIYNKDSQKLNVAIEKMNNVHKNLIEYKGLFTEILCVPAIGLAKLASFKNMDVGCDEIPLLSKFVYDNEEINDDVDYLK